MIYLVPESVDIGLIYFYSDEEYCNFLETNFPHYNERMVTVPVSFHILQIQFETEYDYFEY